MVQALSIAENLESLVVDYQRLWPLLAGLHGRIAKLAGPDRVKSCGRRLGMLSRQGGKKGIAFTHEMELAVFQDYLLYMHRPHGISLVQQMCNRRPFPAGSDEQQLLTGMAQARFSVFWIKELVAAGGFVALDIIRGEEFFILDQSLPHQDGVGLLSAFRIFPFGSAWIHTGAHLSFGRIEDAQGLKTLGRMLNAREEQELNEENIARWRQLLNEEVD